MNPVPPRTFTQHQLRALNRNPGDRFQWIDRNRELFGGRGCSVPKSIVWANEVGSHSRVHHMHSNDLSAFYGAGRRCWIICVEGKRAVASTQVGSAKTG